MKLKTKIIIISVCSIIFFAVMVLWIQKNYILPTYSKIEQVEAGKDLCQAYDFLIEYINNCKLIAEDIAASKDVYSINEHQKTLKMLKSDIFNRLINRSNAEIILIFNNEQQLVYNRKKADLRNYDVVSLSKYIKKYNLLFSEKDCNPNSYSGLISTPEYDYIVSSVPIINYEIDKTVGTIAVCCPLNKEFFNTFTLQIKSPVNIYNLKYVHKRPPIDPGIVLELVKKSAMYFEKPEIDSDFSSCYKAVKDIHGKPVFILATNLSRNIYLEAHSMIKFAVYVMIIFGVLLIVIITNVIQYTVVRPIIKLTKSTIKIKNSEDLSLRTTFHSRKDEIGILSIEFNNLLEQVQHHIEDMEEIIAEKTREIRATREDTIFRLSMAVDEKDAGAGKHMKLVQQMMLLFAEKMKLRKSKCEMFAVASTLHDIGKIGIPEYILGKTGKYSKEEFEAMKAHTVIGGKIFSNSDSELVITAKQIALYHHEHWDGSGYPEGLKEKDIPLPARMMTIIDIFNGMLSKRTYREEKKLEEVIDFLKENSGKIFDPDILNIFIENIQQFIKIQKKYTD